MNHYKDVKGERHKKYVNRLFVLIYVGKIEKQSIKTDRTANHEMSTTILQDREIEYGIWFQYSRRLWRIEETICSSDCSFCLFLSN